MCFAPVRRHQCNHRTYPRSIVFAELAKPQQVQSAKSVTQRLGTLGQPAGQVARLDRARVLGVLGLGVGVDRAFLRRFLRGH